MHVFFANHLTVHAGSLSWTLSDFEAWVGHVHLPMAGIGSTSREMVLGQKMDFFSSFISGQSRNLSE